MTEQAVQTTPRVDLDAVMASSLKQFELPPPPADQTVDAMASGPAQGPGTQPTAAPPPPADGDKAHDAPAQPDAIKPPGESKEEVPPPQRFKTHEEAETAYLHQRRHVTKIEQENSELKKKIQKIEQEKSTLAAAETAKEKTAALKTYIKAQEIDALKKIEALDPDSDSYAEDVAAIQAEKQVNISMFQPATQAGDPPSPALTDTAGLPLPTPQAPPGQPANHPAEPDETPGHAEAVAFMKDALKSAGIPDDDPVFYGFAAQAAKTDESGAPVSFQDQVARAIEQTKQYMSAQKTRFRQDIDVPLTRGAQRPGGGAPASVKRVSIADALQAVAAERKL